MNSHRFIEEENAMLKERIRVLEAALLRADKFLEGMPWAVTNPPSKSIATISYDCNELREVRYLNKEALTPQPKE